MKQSLTKKLREQKAKNLFRTLKSNTLPCSFASNDYLGIGQCETLKSVIIEAINSYGVTSGAAQTIGGFSMPHAELVAALCEFTGTEDACLFSSGYMANLALLSAVAESSHAIYLDKKSHSSLIKGAQMSKADLVRYKHLDTGDLLSKVCKDGFIVTDTVFSMSGEIAPIEQLARLASDNLYLILDDAHGIGMIGPNGKGALNAFKLKNATCTITFGKSLGTIGAAIVGTKLIIENVRQFASPFLFTTAIPPAVAVATRKSLEIITQETWRHEKLMHNISYFRNLAYKYNLAITKSYTAIQYLKCNSIAHLMQIKDKLAKAGIEVQAIRPPTVSKRDIGLRIVLNTGHTEQVINNLVKEIVDAQAT